GVTQALDDEPEVMEALCERRTGSSEREARCPRRRERLLGGPGPARPTVEAPIGALRVSIHTYLRAIPRPGERRYAGPACAAPSSSSSDRRRSWTPAGASAARDCPASPRSSWRCS